MKQRFRLALLAMVYLLTFISVNGKDITDHLTQAESLLDTDPKESIRLCNTLLDNQVENETEKSKVLNIRGMAYYATMDYDMSLLDFNNVIKTPDLQDHVYAMAFNGIGLNQLATGHLNTALAAFKSALKLEPKASELKGSILNNIGAAQNNLGDIENAMTYYLEAIKVFEATVDMEQLAIAYNNVGYLNQQLGNFEYALDNYNSALNLHKEEKSTDNQVSLLLNIGTVYEQLLGEYDEAMTYYQRAFELIPKLEDENNASNIYIRLGSTYHQTGEYEKARTHYKQALAIKEKTGDQKGIVDLYNYIGALNYRLSSYDKAITYYTRALDLATELEYLEGIKVSYSYLANTYAAMENYEEAYNLSQEYASLTSYIENKNQVEGLQKLQEEYETQKKNKEIELLTLDNHLKDSKYKQQLTITYGFILVAILIFLFAVLIIKEKVKSDSLLKNILPDKVAKELKKTGKTVPEEFHHVTVFFSDFTGFTEMSSKLTPEKLITELSDLFTAFDNIMTRHGCERIKTIGDAYLAVCGMPTPNENHAINMLSASKDILAYLEERNTHTDIQWSIRIGIHTGTVVGGVVGNKKYIYDIFGDTVNTASRMESNSLPMHIHVSSDTYTLVKDRFEFIKRQPLDIKGKGIMDTYFLSV